MDVRDAAVKGSAHARASVCATSRLSYLIRTGNFAEQQKELQAIERGRG